MEFFWLHTPDLWGDYGRILMSGMAGPPEEDEEGLLALDRTGPFVPPISKKNKGS